MGRRRSTLIPWFGSLEVFFFIFSLLHDHVIHSTPSTKPNQVYIVYLGRKYMKNNDTDKFITSKRHLHLLSKVFSSFSGFSAMLNSSQVDALAKRKEVISIFKSKSVKLQTTRSWDFMGLSLTNNNNNNNNEAITPLQLAYGNY
ncbi:hypothetical protein F8388_003585 [Cannabis sativa]|uniref:Inhibitor I9 domain-containing protein n=1 Tax=Cannabis sativa TaxID=3483 RepID=A0A7J6EMA6_CANSA|nr:hypothetical protein F8388_003585 [Cannabis sativa]